MLTTQMQRLIHNHSAGMVATVNADGTPAVSPKATFVILDAQTLAFGNIRSPGTLANLRDRPALEVCFLNVLTRQAVRVGGTAAIIAREDADAGLAAAFEAAFADYVPHMSAFVTIAVSAAELILSPAYDLGHGAAELRDASLARLQGL